METKNLPFPNLGYSHTSAHAKAPKILLVDDDPIFCASVKRQAKKMNLDLTICKTLGDITKMSRKPDFDVAILDYFFGQELTAFQISDFFSKEVPVVLISNTEGRKLSGDSWPSEIRTFIHKSAGTKNILAEALLAAHWGHLIPVQAWPTIKDNKEWWFPLAAALLAAATTALLWFVVGQQHPFHSSEWGKVQAWAYVSLLERKLYERY